MLSQTGYADLFQALQYIKQASWSYEKEWRIVSGARPREAEMFGDYGYEERDLAAIYFGFKCSGTDRSDLLALLAHGLGHVRAFDTISDAQRGQLIFRPIER
jgi:hypothetical protein